MTTTPLPTKRASSKTGPLAWPGIGPAALWSVVQITTQRQARGKKNLLVAALLSLPLLLGGLIRQFNDVYYAGSAENLLIFVLLLHALLPLLALLYGSSLVQDEIEEQTLTYLLVRPIPRWAVYAAKIFATFLSTYLRASLFTVATFVLVRYGAEADAWTGLARRLLVILGIEAVGLAAYVAIFSLLGLWSRKALAIGAVYIILFEGALSYLDFSFRNITVMLHMLVLCVRWLDVPGVYYAIDLSTAPAAATSLLVLCLTTVVMTLAGAWVFSAREYRLKTPDGV